MEFNPEAQNIAKLFYFSNQIIYKSRINERQMRFRTDYLDYLKSAKADSITYDNSTDFGKFIIDMKVKRDGEWVSN